MEENKSALSTILLVLLCTNLFLLLFSNPKSLLVPEPAAAFDPADFIISRLSAILMVYLSSLPFSEHQPSSLQALLHRIRRTWRRPALTFLCVELYYTALASLLLMLKSLAKATGGAAASEAAVILGSVASMLWLSPVLFAHSEIACKMSVVMSVVEEGEVGMEAVRRAGEMVEGRKVKLQGFVLTVVMAAAERAAEGLVVVGVVVRLVVWFVYTGFYYECKRGGHKNGRAPLSKELL